MENTSFPRSVGSSSGSRLPPSSATDFPRWEDFDDNPSEATSRSPFEREDPHTTELEDMGVDRATSVREGKRPITNSAFCNKMDFGVLPLMDSFILEHRRSSPIVGSETDTCLEPNLGLLDPAHFVWFSDGIECGDPAVTTEIPDDCFKIPHGGWRLVEPGVAIKMVLKQEITAEDKTGEFWFCNTEPALANVFSNLKSKIGVSLETSKSVKNDKLARLRDPNWRRGSKADGPSVLQRRVWVRSCARKASVKELVRTTIKNQPHIQACLGMSVHRYIRSQQADGLNEQPLVELVAELKPGWVGEQCMLEYVWGILVNELAGDVVKTIKVFKSTEAREDAKASFEELVEWGRNYKPSPVVYSIRDVADRLSKALEKVTDKDLDHRQRW